MTCLTGLQECRVASSHVFSMSASLALQDTGHRSGIIHCRACHAPHTPHSYTQVHKANQDTQQGSLRLMGH